MLIDITSLDDARLAPYRSVKEAELARDGDRFIAEGHFVVQRLLRSDFEVESVLLAQRQVEPMRAFLRPGVPVYVAPDATLREILGFQFHSGVIAVARRKPPRPLGEVIDLSRPRLTLVVLPETSGLQNVGSIIRIAAAFGIDAVVVGEKSADPFYRLPVRVSMGNCFRLPVVRSSNLAADLTELRDQWGIEMMATVCEEPAEPLAQTMRPARVALLFGGEGYGLSPQWLQLCHRRVTIPMQGGTDSLNVAVSAAVFLYHFTQLR
jgi:tRNA G18 (ribose-2'-O)-methylase SpoU